jgi:peptidoglycan/xylan/chitin deacetylase (PgdA/CDA1 family)
VQTGKRKLRKLFSIKKRILGTITHVITHEPIVALTFDDGPHPTYTPRLLDILEKHQAHATFFVVGEMAQKHSLLIQNTSLAGHEIGNHSWDHPSFPEITRSERWKQIQACTQTLAPFGQRLFRPPYGDQNGASRFDALLLGQKVITWNIVAMDWLDHNADWLFERLASRIQPGCIVLLHDGLYHTTKINFVDREPMLQAVDMLLERFSHSYRFVTVSELLRKGRPAQRKWQKKSEIDWLNQLVGRDGNPVRRYVPKP